MKRLMMALAVCLPALAAGLAHANPGDFTMAESAATAVTNEDIMDELEEMRALLGLSTQVAIVMVVPERCVVDISGRPRCFVYTYLLGSTIDNFPAGTVNATTGRFDNRRLPQGKYLVETHQPRSTNPLCHSNVSAAPNLELVHTGITTQLWRNSCAQMIVGTHSRRLDFGSRIYTVGTEGFDFRPIIYFPRAWVDASTSDTSRYRVHTGSIKITKLR